MAHGNAIPRPSREELEDAYINQRMTQAQVAEKFGVSPATANRWLKDAGIPSRIGRWSHKDVTEEPIPEPPPRTMRPRQAKAGKWVKSASPENQERARLAARELLARRWFLLERNRSPQSVLCNAR